MSEKETIAKKQKDYLFSCVSSYYERPPVIKEGKGCILTDVDGKEYLDFFGGVLTVSLGHADERVNRAVKAQLDRVTHTSTIYPNAPITDLAELIAKIAPKGLTKSYFTASGTEADETAMMLCQVFTGNTEMIAPRHGYCGRSLLAQSMTAHSTWRAIPSQVAGAKHCLAPYCYRCPMGLKYPDCKVRCATDIEELILTATIGRIGGFLVEPVMGVGGFVVPPKEYLQTAADIVRRYGGLFISDEVQTGWGRTGRKMWGIEHSGITPDIMTMAKGVANGLPLGVTTTRPEIGDCIKVTTFSTFGGNPVSCVAAIETIKTILEERLCDRSEEMGNLLRNRLEGLKERYPNVVGDVRGMGLMQAIEFVKDETTGDRTPNQKLTKAFIEETGRRGLLLGKGGLYGNVVRIAPPLKISKTQIEDATKIISESLAAIV